MKIKTKDFEVSESRKKILSKFETRIQPFFEGEDLSKKALKESQKELAIHQELLYAQNQWSVLVILQGMDTAGKDSLIEHVTEGVNPQGCEVTSFKKPTHLETDYDFLWRCHREVPQRGKIGIFNRSYYEDLVVPMVHPNALDASQIPKHLRESKEFFEHRAKDIVHFENYLARQGTQIVKIFLHLSKDEQKNRLLARLDNADKNWKFDQGDLVEREFWDDYQKAYNFCFEHTSHRSAPWYVLPADDKMTARLIAAKLINAKIDELNLAFPKVDSATRKALAKARTQLAAT